MVRRLILAVAILAMAAVPGPALARDGGQGFHGGFHGGHEFHGGPEFHHGGHERFERHGRFEHFHGFGFYPYPYYGCPYYAYGPPACYWPEY